MTGLVTGDLDCLPHVGTESLAYGIKQNEASWGSLRAQLAALALDKFESKERVFVVKVYSAYTAICVRFMTIDAAGNLGDPTLELFYALVNKNSAGVPSTDLLFVKVNRGCEAPSRQTGALRSCLF